MLTAEQIETREFLTYAEVAKRTGLAVQTLYHWKRLRKLTGDTGLVMVGGNPRIDWMLFVRSFVEVPK